jgi:hypothetical protein
VSKCTLKATCSGYAPEIKQLSAGSKDLDALFTWSPSAVSTDGSKSYNRRQSKPGAYKVCFGLVTSEPRVVDSVCVYVIAIKCQHVVLPAAL